MSSVEQVNRDKWLSILIFLIIDILQIFFVSLLAFDENNAWLVSLDQSRSNPVVSISVFVFICILQFLMIYGVAWYLQKHKDIVELFPSYDESIEFKCRYDRDEIVSWIFEIAEKSSVTVKKILLLRSPLPNAMTFSLPLMGSVVVVNSNLLDLMNPEEVKSILAHEIGHIRNNDSLVSIFSNMPTVFVDTVYIYVYIRILIGVFDSLLVELNPLYAIMRIAIFFGFFVVSRVMMTITRMFVTRAARNAEKLADQYAASILGVESTINALLRLGQRVETITVLIEEIKWLVSLNPERKSPLTNAELLSIVKEYPLDAIDQDTARKAAPWLFLSTRLKNLRKAYGIDLSDEQINDAVEPATEQLLQIRDQMNEEEEEPLTVDWREQDLDKDERLSMEEIKDFIEVLRRDPEKMLFDSEVGKNLLVMTHPDFRSRVLFVADVFDIA